MHGHMNIKMNYRHSPSYDVVTFRKVRYKLNLAQVGTAVYMWSTIYVCTRKSSWNPDSNTLEPEWLQHDRPATRVIAQQYSSATFVSLRFPSHKVQFGTHF